jgi:glycosyltransferase involved in cell wall biosynthesis
MIPANRYWMKLFKPEKLHRLFVKETYDVEVSYLEGSSARIISGCENPGTKLVCWIHVQQSNIEHLADSFRNEKEARNCYNRFQKIICVSEFVKKDFCGIINYSKPCAVLHNTVESDVILDKAKENTDVFQEFRGLRLIAVGTLKKSKGYERLLSIIKRLQTEGYIFCLYILGTGPMVLKLKSIVQENNLEDTVHFLGYQLNPYKYVAKCDLFICSSYSEGFSTAATEALIVGTPVCTVDVSGMKEMLGENNEYGIVTENSEEALYEGIKRLLDDPKLLAYYKKQAEERGKMFSKEKTVHAVEEMLEGLFDQ